MEVGGAEVKECKACVGRLADTSGDCQGELERRGARERRRQRDWQERGGSPKTLPHDVGEQPLRVPCPVRDSLPPNSNQTLGEIGSGGERHWGRETEREGGRGTWREGEAVGATEEEGVERLKLRAVERDGEG